MRSIGLDLSTRTGLVVLEPGPVVRESIEVAPKSKGWVRVQEITDTILGTITTYSPDEVVIEGYGFANQHTLVTLAEIGSVVRYCLYLSGVAYREIPPNQLKKFVTGKGNAKKDAITLNVYKRWGYEAETDNVADAYGLAAIGLACHGALGVGVPMTCAQSEIISRVA